jgi:hypothetical protein
VQILEVGLKMLGRGTGRRPQARPARARAAGRHDHPHVGHALDTSLFTDNGAERAWRWLEVDQPAELEELEGIGVLLDPTMGTQPPAEAGSSVTIKMTPRALGNLQRYLHVAVSPQGRTPTLRLEVFFVGTREHIKPLEAVAFEP